MPIPVNIFNANSLSINVNVNNASRGIEIAAAAGPNWTPAVPATGPTFIPGPPTPGSLGIGVNNVVITPWGMPSMFVAPIYLPDTVNWSSIQIYIFFQSYSSCSWIVLNAGQQISQGVVTSELAMAEPEPTLYAPAAASQTELKGT